jgi:adenylosuccinate lyase
MPYERLKEMTRGRKVTMDDFKNFISTLEVTENVRQELLEITPRNYTGIASLLTDLD